MGVKILGRAVAVALLVAVVGCSDSETNAPVSSTADVSPTTASATVPATSAPSSTSVELASPATTTEDSTTSSTMVATPTLEETFGGTHDFVVTRVDQAVERSCSTPIVEGDVKTLSLAFAPDALTIDFPPSGQFAGTKVDELTYSREVSDGFGTGTITVTFSGESFVLSSLRGGLACLEYEYTLVR